MPLIAQFSCDGAGCDAAVSFLLGRSLPLPTGWTGDKGTGQYFCPSCSAVRLWDGFTEFTEQLAVQQKRNGERHG
jgi:hypothetical protein